MARILNVRTEGVTQGVLGGDFALKQDLVEVTFEDANGVPHTIFAHKSGRFQTPEDIVRAWENHELDTNPVAPAAPVAPSPEVGGVFQ